MFEVCKLKVSGAEGQAALDTLRQGGDGSVVYGGKKIGTWHRCNGNYPLSVRPVNADRDDGDVGGLSPNEAVEYLLASKDGQRVGGNVFPDHMSYILRVAEMRLAGDTLVARVYYNVNTATGSSSASTPAKSALGRIDLKTGTIVIKGDVKTFVNQGEILRRIKVHLGSLYENKPNEQQIG